MYNNYHNSKNQAKQGTTQTAPDPFSEPFFRGNNLNPNWVEKNAMNLSREITSGKQGKEGKKGKEGMTSTSIRNFYNEFLRIKALPLNRKDEKVILMKLLVAKVNYKLKQPGSNVHELFAKFITKLVKEIDDNIDRFDKSCYILEAIIGYSCYKDEGGNNV